MHKYHRLYSSIPLILGSMFPTHMHHHRNKYITGRNEIQRFNLHLWRLPEWIIRKEPSLKKNFKGQNLKKWQKGKKRKNKGGTRGTQEPLRKINGTANPYKWKHETNKTTAWTKVQVQGRGKNRLPGRKLLHWRSQYFHRYNVWLSWV